MEEIFKTFGGASLQKHIQKADYHLQFMSLTVPLVSFAPLLRHWLIDGWWLFQYTGKKQLSQYS